MTHHFRFSRKWTKLSIDRHYTEAWGLGVSLGLDMDRSPDGERCLTLRISKNSWPSFNSPEATPSPLVPVPGLQAVRYDRSKS